MTFNRKNAHMFLNPLYQESLESRDNIVNGMERPLFVYSFTEGSLETGSM